MSLLITIDMLHRFHHYSIQFLPNEISALLIGAQFNKHVVITNFVHVEIANASEVHVLADGKDISKKVDEYYVVGFIHTHPSEEAVVYASDKDIKYQKTMTEWFLKRFGRKPYFMIYAPSHAIFSVYAETEPHKDYQIVSALVTEGGLCNR